MFTNGAYWMGSCLIMLRGQNVFAFDQLVRSKVFLWVPINICKYCICYTATVHLSSESCKAEPDAGPCFGMVQRYFYNSTSMGCQLFTYGGCMGNQNNFVTERECLQSCRTEAACRMPMDAQPCTGQPKIWAFDPNSGLCLEYKKDYCQGNSNKFYSKGECDEYCGVMKDGETEFLKAN
ncbi:unnamed protein product [Oncorhynchus mykiss]|uniref:BPTI/Kunitz inhibitor domain-containing protein n=1 Tax=Oncorhynchus mykiss TaxID=8022 RepID=A0A060YC43_ONCMY|nr:unnamed protein product [Oncorhynchus mykiss]